MDRKIKDDHGIPRYQQWLYDLADKGLGKVIFAIWVLVAVVLGITLLFVRWFVAHFR